MPSVAFPFQSTFQRGSEWSSTVAGRQQTVTVQEDVVVEVRDVTGDPSVSIVLDATDRTGEHRMLKVDDRLYSAVVGGERINGRGGHLSGEIFSTITQPTHHILPVGSRILVVSPSTREIDPLDALDQFEASGHALGRERFSSQLQGAVSMGGILYLPTKAIPALALRRDEDNQDVVMLVDPATVTDKVSTHRFHDGEMLIPWSAASLANALDRGIDLRVFDVEALSVGDMAPEYYTVALDGLAKRILGSIGLVSIAGKTPAFLRDYADAVDAVGNDPAAAWSLLNGPLRSSLSPNDRIRVTTGAMIAALPDADAVLDPVNVHATTRDLNSALSDVVTRLQDPLSRQLADAMQAALAPLLEDQIPVLRRLRDEALRLTEEMRREHLPDHPELLEAIVGADHCLASNARHEIGEPHPAPNRTDPAFAP